MNRIVPLVALAGIATGSAIAKTHHTTYNDAQSNNTSTSYGLSTQQCPRAFPNNTLSGGDFISGRYYNISEFSPIASIPYLDRKTGKLICLQPLNPRRNLSSSFEDQIIGRDPITGRVITDPTRPNYTLSGSGNSSNLTLKQ